MSGPQLDSGITRRDFLKVLGGGLLFAISMDYAVSGAQVPPGNQIVAWLHIAQNGSITIYTGKVEIGQGAQTELTQCASEELRVPIRAIQIVMGDTDKVQFDMGTFGSLTTPMMVPKIRIAAASAREVLLDFAGEKMNVDRSTLTAVNGSIKDPQSGRAMTYGQLTEGKALLNPVGTVSLLTQADKWTVMGRSAPKLNAREVVTGSLKYVTDISKPGMLHGMVLRSPSYGAQLVSLDTRKAAATPGAKAIHEDDFVAIAAPKRYLAEKALSLVTATWTEVRQPSSKSLYAYLRDHAGREDVVRSFGTRINDQQPDGTLFKETYAIPYIAHVPLETRAASAEWNNGELTLQVGTQVPFSDRSQVASFFGLKAEQVHFTVPPFGSGYGGKHCAEVAIDAARIAKATGKPVHIAWTREEEFSWAYFRPAGVMDVKAVYQHNGNVTQWEFGNINSGNAGLSTPYNIPNQHIVFYPSVSPLKQGAYRALAATANQFARETAMDEIAVKLKMDPLAFRIANLNDDRIIAVLNAAADKFGWTKWRKKPGHGIGISCGFEKGGRVATAVEVIVTKGVAKVARLVTAFDCGAVINPDNLKNQIEGMAMMGIGGALFESISFENGKIANNRLSSYRVPRMTDMPVMEAVLVDRKDQPSAGAGEVPIICVAPAIGNAIFNATGVRKRTLPFNP